VPPAVHATFAAAAHCFAGLVEDIPPTAWNGPGLGVWDLRALVGHTSRAVSTVATYLRQPAERVRVASAARYYAQFKQQSAGNLSAVTERGRQAGAALGPQPALAVRTLVEETLGALEAVPDNPVIETIAGGMRLSAYLPTRTFELTVHSLDIGAATGIDVTPPAAALRESLHLGIDIALIYGDGHPVLRALTGRQPLPTGYSIV
jgi:uncharacterized protein (TIGR03083 family)